VSNAISKFLEVWTSRYFQIPWSSRPPGVYIFIFDNAFGMFSWCSLVAIIVVERKAGMLVVADFHSWPGQNLFFLVEVVANFANLCFAKFVFS